MWSTCSTSRFLGNVRPIINRLIEQGQDNSGGGGAVDVIYCMVHSYCVDILCCACQIRSCCQKGDIVAGW